MDRRSQEDKPITDYVSEWLTKHKRNFAANKAVDSHITQIVPTFSESAGPQEAVELSLMIFREVRRQLLQTGEWPPVYVVLSLQLGGGKRRFLREVPRSVAEVVAQLRKEPPSVYIIDAARYHVAFEWEEYQSPLPFDLLEKDANLQVKYREFRDGHAISNKWEYSRNIYARYWTGS